jgi:uncharacterized protein with von Willebrand factor type A (vWA) domain
VTEPARRSDVTRALSELFYALRRDGLTFSTAQVLDAMRVVALLGFTDRARLRAGLEAVLVSRRDDREVFRRAFDDLLAGERAHASDLFGRLRLRGFSDTELDSLRDVLDALARTVSASSGGLALQALRAGELDLQGLLRSAGLGSLLARMRGPSQVGYFAHAAAERLGIQRAAAPLARIEAALVESLDRERGQALASALRDELQRLRRRVRTHVEAEAARQASQHDGSSAGDLRPDPAELDVLRRGLRVLAERLRGRERVRARRARRGRIDLRRTLRAAMGTGGVPVRLVRRRRRRDKPRLVLLCDLSESVRAVSGLLLEFVALAHELFARTRSFVFVSEVAEVTSLLAERPIERALSLLASGAAVRTTDNSNYARALSLFRERFSSTLDRHTTLVVLGDGRTNFHGDGLEALDDLARRVRALVWVTPEPRSAWGTGDSAMERYAARAAEVLVARTADELVAAARALSRRR